VLLEPELKLGKAYMDGSLVIEHGSIADLLEMAMEAGYGRALRRAHRRASLRSRRAARRAVSRFRSSTLDGAPDPHDQASGEPCRSRATTSVSRNTGCAPSKPAATRPCGSPASDIFAISNGFEAKLPGNYQSGRVKLFRRHIKNKIHCR
jgi:hypothetical protein